MTKRRTEKLWAEIDRAAAEMRRRSRTKTGGDMPQRNKGTSARRNTVSAELGRLAKGDRAKPANAPRPAASRVAIYLPRELKRRLRLAAAAEDKDMSRLAVEALEQYLDTKGL